MGRLWLKSDVEASDWTRSAFWHLLNYFHGHLAGSCSDFEQLGAMAVPLDHFGVPVVRDDANSFGIVVSRWSQFQGLLGGLLQGTIKRHSVPSRQLAQEIVGATRHGNDPEVGVFFSLASLA